MKTSFDHLKSGDFDIIVEKGEEKLNLSELLRDLYVQIISIQKTVAELKNKIPMPQKELQVAQLPEIGGPPGSNVEGSNLA
jgi:hypothetical protein